MTYLDPAGIVPLMDAITDGWTAGRRTPQLALHRWEQELDRPLCELRSDWRIEPTPLARRLWARRQAAGRSHRTADLLLAAGQAT